MEVQNMMNIAFFIGLALTHLYTLATSWLPFLHLYG